MRVLLIEDDSAVAESIYLMLRSEGFRTQIAERGKKGLELARLYDFDMILLDLHLPDISGATILRTLRSEGNKTPIMIVSGLAGIQDKVNGLSLGADDYLTKPFHKDELIARIHAITRRCKGQASSIIQIGGLVVNVHAQRVKVYELEIALTGKEYSLLELLALRAGSTVSKEMILNRLYAGEAEPGVKIVDVFVCKLRKKIAEASDGKEYIETVWGKGYVLREPADTSKVING